MIEFKQVSGPQLGGLKRLMKNLPIISGVIAKTQAKTNADAMLRIMKQGLHKRGWLTPRLAPSTILDKRRRGFPFVHEILLATGEGPGTMIGSLQIRETKDGYTMRPYGTHKRSGLPAVKIWTIHEYGATIVRGGHTFYIPARAPFRQALKDFSKEKQSKASSKVASSAIKKSIYKELRK